MLTSVLVTSHAHISVLKPTIFQLTANLQFSHYYHKHNIENNSYTKIQINIDYFMQITDKNRSVEISLETILARK